MEFPAAFFGANFRCSLCDLNALKPTRFCFARWIHGKTQPARQLARMKLEFPIFQFLLLRKSQVSKEISLLYLVLVVGIYLNNGHMDAGNLQLAQDASTVTVTDLERDPNGDSYEGEFKNGTRHGNGKMLWDDGEDEGEWKDRDQDGSRASATFFVTWHKGEKGSKKWTSTRVAAELVLRRQLEEWQGTQQGHLIFLTMGTV